MSGETARAPDGFVKQAVEAAIRIGVVALVVVWSLRIISPFIEVVLWAVILAVAVYPLHTGLTRRLGGRVKLAAVLIAVVALAALLVPSGLFFAASFDEARKFAGQAEAGTLQVPPPPAGVRDWPLVGERVYATWHEAASQLGSNLERFRPELAAFGKRALSALTGLTGTVLQFLISILIAAALLTTRGSSRAFLVKFATRLAGPTGEGFVRLAVATIRSVFTGVLGVALIQSALSAIGMLLLGVPGAMVWALLVLILAVAQVPPLLVLGPVMVWALATQSPVVAVIFVVYGLLVSVSDSFLKPLLLGRGVDVPMLVILLGAIGGMVHSGIIGLFVGAVVLAVAYQLMMAWLEQDADRGLPPQAEATVRASDGA